MNKPIYITDANGELAAVNKNTGEVHDIGNTGVQLTDISFAPDHHLYGISFSELYRINPINGHATDIGPLEGGNNNMNALAIDAAGRAYAYSAASDELYGVDLQTGHATALGESSHSSAGDLTFFRGNLLLADTQDQLVSIDPNTGSATRQVADHTSDLFGLIATDPNHLYGFAETSMYSFNPMTGSKIFDADLSGSGIGQIYGAAYNGYFTHGS